MTARTETHSNSTISLTLGILSIIIPVIGMILGVIGIVYSRKATRAIVNTNESGKGLATSGLICSVAGIIIQFFILLLVVSSMIAFFSIFVIQG
ncbi:DUF4190 domain-containing protein [Gracilibacillus caseinilyticus]|uniref:DUF4190 domain-containing protein n=1 Tax=Gracilibacillus caseinilyticus TaxID=2932256 RepID=A0ABY4EZF6_9BACI|nr:DUF4190 domain-containing protein [Gracilibacillus caseinilyticus]UOQ49791.1 DUF4190 domain-containing protein [Gracilibacillus caseinilyticus]